MRDAQPVHTVPERRGANVRGRAGAPAVHRPAPAFVVACVLLAASPVPSAGAAAQDGRNGTPGAGAGTGASGEATVADGADTDADGVPDRRDVCLDRPGPTPVDRFGCPVDGGNDGESDDTGDGERTARVLDGVTFPVGESHLDGDARATLDRLARALLADTRPGDATRVHEVAAHTDGVGSETRNLSLSVRRAAAVRHYLLLRGVSPNRLRARGYGETRPLADNRTEAGRRTNRRVEIRPVKTRE